MHQGKGRRIRQLSPAESYMLAVVLGIVLAAAFLVVWESWSGEKEGDRPNFASYSNVQDKKDAFFGYLLPCIHELNREWLEDRERILELSQRAQAEKKIKKKDRNWLLSIAEKAKFDDPSLEDPDFFQDLLSRVDAIPPSLALAQAANESAWGTSRFALEGNNFYGIWCYEPGCGLVPRRRPAGETYEVTRYGSPEKSVRDYFYQLNTGSAYLPFRLIRRRLREQGEPITGIRLANGLERYSERGMAYVGDIQNLIRSNNLETYDR